MANNTLPVIGAVNFLETYVEALILVLQIFTMDIGWTITYIIGILFQISTHKIQLESKCIPRFEHQRHFNPPLQVMVKKLIIRWLDVGMGHPIADSKWVSPI